MTAADHRARVAVMLDVAERLERAFPEMRPGSASPVVGVAPSAAAAHAFIIDLADREEHLARVAEADARAIPPARVAALIDSWGEDV